MAEEKSESQVVVYDDARRQAQLEVTANFRKATSVAGLCKDIVIKTAVKIGDKQYVPVASWEAISTAHGYVVSTRDVEYVKGAKDESGNGFAGGFRSVAELKSMDDGMIIATAEGFVGEDEPVWFGGTVLHVWNKKKRIYEDKTYTKRPDAAIKAMTQTRAAGRVCKQAFAHVVVLMNAGLSTTPLEEIIDAELIEEDGGDAGTPTPGEPIHDWKNVYVHFGPKHGPGCDEDHPRGRQLGELSSAALSWFQTKWEPKGHNGNPPSDDDLRLRRALDMSIGKIPVDAKEAEVTQAEIPLDAKKADASEPPA